MAALNPAAAAIVLGGREENDDTEQALLDIDREIELL